MKKIIFVLLLILGFTQNSKGDTIDSWHVFYNMKQVGDFDQNSDERANQIVIKAESVHAKDSITILYFRDTPCDKCPTSLMIEDENHHRVLVSKGRGTFKPVSFSVKDLIEEKKRSDKTSFVVFYSEEQGRYGIDERMLFRIKFE